MMAWPLASVLADAALMAPPVALKLIVAPSMTALLESRAMAVMVALSELSEMGYLLSSSRPYMLWFWRPRPRMPLITFL